MNTVTMTDITGSLAALRTKRTIPGYIRAKEEDKQGEKKKGENSKLSKPASVRFVRNVQNSGGLPPDQAAWLPVARQILAGEFDGADGSTQESLTIGLRSIPHPDCRRALDKLSAAKT